MPAFTAPPTIAPPLGFRPFSPPIRTIRPNWRLRMPGSAARTRRNRPHQLDLQGALDVGVADLVHPTPLGVARAEGDQIDLSEPGLGLANSSLGLSWVFEIAAEGRRFGAVRRQRLGLGR